MKFQIIDKSSPISYNLYIKDTFEEKDDDYMTLQDQLMSDLKDSMKNKETLRKNVITMVRAEIKQVEVDEKVEVDDEKIIEIISKQVKEKKNVIEDFKKADRDDLVEKTQAEIDILMDYMPEQLSDQELEAIVKEVIEENNFDSMKDMGQAMGKIMPKIKGRADGGQVSDLVKKQLQN